jgi:hypothetical protein
MKKHGYCKTKTYSSWKAMKSRVLNKNNKFYHRYGGRGICIQKEWLDFSNFLADMGERPQNTTLDRIDVNGDYCKSNCRWATKIVQQMNCVKVKNKTSKFKGVCWSNSKNKWRSYINVNKKAKHLGYFASEKEAAIAYNKAVSLYYGNWAYFNKME